MTDGDDEAWARFVWACVHDRPEAGRMLDADPSLAVRKPGSETALHWLAVEGHRDAVEFLLGRGADPDPRGAGESTALHDVCVLGNADLADVLLHHGADPTARNHAGSSVLSAAARSGSARLVRRILQAGAHIDGEDGEEAVVDAVRAGAADVLDLLLTRGARADFLRNGMPVFAFLPDHADRRARIEEILRSHGVTKRLVYEKHDQELSWTYDEWLRVVCGEDEP